MFATKRYDTLERTREKSSHSVMWSGKAFKGSQPPSTDVVLGERQGEEKTAGAERVSAGA